jgi:hypothetical protein
MIGCVRVHVRFSDWTRGRAVPSLGTNSGTAELPFQSWLHFKEAFAPELVARAVEESAPSTKRCLDPFGGSGTTALACQFLGVRPLTIEVNPFLADLIEAKLSTYDPDALARDFGLIMSRATGNRGGTCTAFQGAPATFVEPGVKGRWIFDRAIASRIVALLAAIDELSGEAHRLLFRVLLGGILIEVSNVVISGKGRRYRRSWEKRRRSPHTVDKLFCSTVQQAIAEIHRYAKRQCTEYELRRGDCREALKRDAPCDIAVFSPPYPNSFDYTDVYNVELWTLGYLTNGQSNLSLRTSTLCSHVQLSRQFPQPPSGSAKLNKTLERLVARRAELWDARIPVMIGAYFTDIMTVLEHIRRSLTLGGSVWMVVGDSSYAGIQVNAGEIIAELAPRSGWRIGTVEPFRSMRASVQQGGRIELAENLLVLSKP